MKLGKSNQFSRGPVLEALLFCPGVCHQENLAQQLGSVAWFVCFLILEIDHRRKGKRNQLGLEAQCMKLPRGGGRVR